ncbi:carbohydrate esterase family 10 protein [Ceratobasidium sp. AG-Ba]|nr:carbohydrate esterase family 10 protein [Ceratobasidium sp. AG-Ba]
MVSPTLALANLHIHYLSFFLLFRTAIGAVLPWKPADVQVTASGTVYTGTQSDGQDLFLGIPYAQPPVGDLRFRRPVAATPGPAVNAQSFGPRCLQWFAASDASEDCLTLNIWRPQGATGSLPVMIWICESSSYPGGGIVSTSIAMGQPVIYVSLNYRLGFFGFPVGSQTMRKGTTNLGLYDQRMAIEWVQNNIAAFGGDPTKATLFGESAGAISISYQMMYKGGQIGNAFRAAIMQSGAPASYKSTAQNTKARQKAYDQIASQTGCDKANDSFECLRALDVNILQEAHIATYSLPISSIAYANFPAAYGPITDPSDDFLPVSPSALVASGKYANIPMISGSNLDEGTWFVSNPKTSLDIISFLASDDVALAFSLNPGGSTPLLPLYPDVPSLGSPYNTGSEMFGREREYKRAASFVGDLLFTVGLSTSFQKAVARNSAVWSYLFTHPTGGPPVFGVSHTAELAYVFGFVSPNSASDVDVSTKMRQYWINFAGQLNPRPSGSSLPQWPTYGTILGKNMLQIKAGDYSVIRDDFRELSNLSILSNPLLQL